MSDKLPLETTRTFDARTPCSRALGSIYVLADGRVSACCFDPLASLCFGDLTRQTLAEVYSSAKYQRFRMRHAAGRPDAYSICAGCTRI